MTEKHVITITVDGGMIQDVEGIPPDVIVRIVDFDTKDADPEDEQIIDGQAALVVDLEAR